MYIQLKKQPKMKIIYAGSPAISVPSLMAIAKLQLDGGDCALLGIITNPDTPKGRHKTPTPTPIGEAALEICRLFTEKGLTPPVIFKRGGSNVLPACDILISFAFGTIFTDKFLHKFPLGGVNVHPSLLPKYRGSTPISTAILNGDAESGITLQKMASEVDSGDILIQQNMTLCPRETTETFSEIVAVRSARMLVEFVENHQKYLAEGKPQDHAAATFCTHIKAQSGKIDWNQSAAKIDAQVRAITAYHACWAYIAKTQGVMVEGQNNIVYILECEPVDPASLDMKALTFDFEVSSVGKVLGNIKKQGIIIKTGDGLLAIKSLQLPTRKALDHNSFLNGAKSFIGTVLG
ncbi:MAG: methionyl-tRNA formyltransferase [Termitinemataceae bacterium]|nr:MAG: methionyl-tRNA formyltransferase [Termitinemataceae bacterium]